MRAGLGPVWLAAALLGLGCAASPPLASPAPKVAPAPLDEPPTASPHPDAPPIPADLPQVVPDELQNAPDPSSRLFACLDFNQPARLAGASLDGEVDADALKARLGELVAARGLCVELVRRSFAGYPPLVRAFEQKWMFYETWLALALIPADQPGRACRGMAYTFARSAPTLKDLIAYDQWLGRELRAAAAPEPYVERLKAQAVEEVLALGRLRRLLQVRYKAACEARP
jgi:hypothetical protein